MCSYWRLLWDAVSTGPFGGPVPPILPAANPPAAPSGQRSTPDLAEIRALRPDIERFHGQKHDDWLHAWDRYLNALADHLEKIAERRAPDA